MMRIIRLSNARRRSAGHRRLRRVCGLLVMLPVLLCRCSAPSESSTPVFFTERVGDAEADYDRASFRSFRKDGRLSAPMTLGNETRLSLTPPLPSRFTFTVTVPPQPVFRFAIAVKTLGNSDVWPPVEFLLSVEEQGQEEELFAEIVNRESPDRWLDREVDLSPWSTRTVRLSFETRMGRQVDHIPWTARTIIPLWGSPVLGSSVRRSDRPNLVLISVDCLRADHVGAYGYGRDTTPNIDRLAADGVVFEKAMSASSWTLPTHMSMLTGLLPSFHRATKWEKLDRSVDYLPELLAGGGYFTSGVASWVYVSQVYGFERGFVVYEVLGELETNAEQVVDAALSHLDRGGGQSQFLMIHLFDPHWPYLPPEGHIDRFGPRPQDISDLLDRSRGREPPRSDTERQQIIDLYDAEIAYLDQQLGRFFDALKARGLYDESVVILTADHGEAFYEHGHWQHSETLFEEIVHVPLIVKWPASSPRGRVASVVSQVDIFPTLVEASGKTPPPTDAVSLLAYARRPERAGNGRVVVSEVSGRSKESRFMKLAFRAEDLKYMALLTGPPGDELDASHLRQEQLYDLTMDPDERNDLASSSPPELRQFRERLQVFLSGARGLGTLRQGQKVEIDEATRNRLRSLGYLDQEIQ